MLDPESPDVRVAVFGRQVEHFLESDIGQYITQCADAEIQAVMTQFATVDADDYRAIRRLQVKMLVAQSVIGWLGDAIQSGKQAQGALNGNQDNENFQ